MSTPDIIAAVSVLINAILCLLTFIFGLVTFIFALRAYQLDKGRFKIEQENYEKEKIRERLLLDVFQTTERVLNDALLLRTEFTISNLLPHEVLIRRLSVRLVFVKHLGLKSSPRELLLYFLFGESRFVLTISFESSSRISMTPLAEVRFDEKFPSAFKSGFSDNCPATIRDLTTKNSVLSDGGFPKIEHGGRVYHWEAIAVLPRTLWHQAEKEDYTFSGTEIGIKFHNGDVVANMSSLIELTKEEISGDADVKRLLQAFESENVGR